MKQVKDCILTVNGGSSSIKFALFEVGDSLQRILAGSIKRIGLPEETFEVKGSQKADGFTRPVTAANHTEAVGVLTDWIGIDRSATFPAPHGVAQHFYVRRSPSHHSGHCFMEYYAEAYKVHISAARSLYE